MANHSNCRMGSPLRLPKAMCALLTQGGFMMVPEVRSRREVWPGSAGTQKARNNFGKQAGF